MSEFERAKEMLKSWVQPIGTREAADHIGEANEKVAADHAELAAELRAFESSDDLGNGDFTVCEFAADALEAALSEIAALRGEHKLTLQDGSEAWCSDAAWRWFQEWAGRLTQAERQRDELRKALPDLSSVIAWLDNGCEPKHAITELGIHKARIDQVLANQGADQ